MWNGFIAQIASYPETIKDTMVAAHGVPQVYVLPSRMFDISMGVSRAEIEFPIYFNFYLNSRKTVLVCRPEQLRPVLRVIQEAVFGPRSLDLAADYPSEAEVPALAGELAWFKRDPKRPAGRLRLRDLVDVHVFDAAGRTRVGEVDISVVGPDRYRFERDGQAREVSFRPPPKPPPAPPSTRRYRPPFFGTTIIGAGHGFDPTSATSGILIWINGRGVLVDPPVDTTRWMRQSGVDSRLIEDLVLTHCHADHDAGTLQKLLEEGRITLHTTPTVIGSFVRKYRGLLGLTGDQLRALFDFNPVTVGEPINIAGANFLFRYNFHPIPTLGFDVRFQNRTMAYSGDHLNDPQMLGNLQQEGLFSEIRLRELTSLSWDADLIFHEAGVPPIHTPVDFLGGLPDEVKARLYVNHISADKIPAGSGLRLAPTGVEQTLELDVTTPPLWLAHRMLDLFAGVDLFQQLDIQKTAEFLRISQYRQFGAGEVLVRTGDPGDEFFLILSGEAEIVQNGRHLTTLGRYDYFGEVAIMLGLKRTADVIAYTDMEALAVNGRDFLRFIRGTEVARTLRLVAESRLHEGWPLMNENTLLERLSVNQKTQLIPLLKERTVGADRLLFREGDRIRCVYLIKQGQVLLQREGIPPTRAFRGALVGKVSSEGERHGMTAVTECQSQVYVLSNQDLAQFFRLNPGTHVRFLAAGRGQLVEMLT